MASKFAGLYQFFTGWNLERTLAVLKPVYGLMKGVPTDHPLSSTYWRKRTPPPAAMDPDRDGCGLLWCSPVAPNDGRDARKLTGIATELLLRHGFEPAISLTVLTGRTISCIVSIAYDREVEGEDQRAQECYRELLDSFARQGYHSYRLGVNSMPAMGDSGGYIQLLQEIKRTLDPGGVLAPGRYLAALDTRWSTGARGADATTSV